MNYQQALEYIHTRPRGSTVAPSLDRIRQLLESFDAPQRSYKTVHIAGTNGKGSVTAMIAGGLEKVGFTVGRFTSPFLERFNERIAVNGQDIPDEDLADLVTRVSAAEEARIAQGGDPMSEFEVVTAAALLYYRERGCDFAVLEVGLGGRFDPTNVIDPPEVAVMTHIALDHTAILGNTLPEIAYQKAGIIKKGSSVVIGPNEPEAVEVFCRESALLGISPVAADLEKTENVTSGLEGSSFTYDGASVSTCLLGKHQIANALTAYLALKALQARGIAISDSQILEGIRDTRWPARLEIVSTSPLTLLDCAHNPDGALALADALDTIFSGRKITAVMGMMADKDWRQCARILLPRCSRVFASTVGQARSLEPITLAAEATEYCEATAVNDLRDAIALARNTMAENGLLLVCGSVILAGEARTILREYNK